MTRRAFVLMELLAASVLLGTLLVLCAALLSASAARRRTVDERHCALAELGNVMERVTARPWAELTTPRLATERLSSWAERQLPAARLTVAVVDAEPDTKQITAAITWEDCCRRPVVPLRLTTWKYRSASR